MSPTVSAAEFSISEIDLNNSGSDSMETPKPSNNTFTVNKVHTLKRISTNILPETDDETKEVETKSPTQDTPITVSHDADTPGTPSKAHHHHPYAPPLDRIDSPELSAQDKP